MKRTRGGVIDGKRDQGDQGDTCKYIFMCIYVVVLQNKEQFVKAHIFQIINSLGYLRFREQLEYLTV